MARKGVFLAILLASLAVKRGSLCHGRTGTAMNVILSLSFGSTIFFLLFRSHVIYSTDDINKLNIAVMLLTIISHTSESIEPLNTEKFVLTESRFLLPLVEKEF
jgi:hypothetical protein